MTVRHDVFISYSSKDKAVADALVHFLEESKIRCWIAPRDISPGSDYAELIDSAISEASIFVMLFSDLSQQSQWCRKETNLAVASSKIILPVRIEDVALSGAMKLYLSDKHWVDAIPDPALHFSIIRDSVLKCLGQEGNISTPYIDCEPACCGKALLVRQIIAGLFIVVGMLFTIGLVVGLCRGVVLESFKIAWLALLLPIGVLLTRRYVFAKFTAESFLCLRPRVVSASFLRYLVGTLLFYFGADVLILGMPLMMRQELMNNEVIDRATAMRIFICWLSFAGVSYAMVKAGIAIFKRDWKKFSFTRMRFAKWALITILPLMSGRVWHFCMNFHR